MPSLPSLKINALVRATLALIVAGLFCSNIALLRSNRYLAAELKDARRSSGLEAAPGTRVPALHGTDFSGAVLDVGYDNHKDALLLVFSPHCPFCARNWPHWEKVLASLNRDRVRPVLLDLSSTVTATFLASHNIKHETVMASVDPAAYSKYSLRITPQTILVRKDGTVSRV